VLCVVEIGESDWHAPLTAFSNGRRRTIAAPGLQRYGRSDSRSCCHPGLSETSSGEEGGHERRTATWSVRPADAKAGFSSVVLADSPLAVPNRHLTPRGIECQHVSGDHRSTRNTGAWDRRSLPRLETCHPGHRAGPAGRDNLLNSESAS
jgi:hypothetical protein